MVGGVYKLAFKFFSSVYVCFCNYIFSSLGVEPIPLPQSEQRSEESEFLLNENRKEERACVATDTSFPNPDITLIILKIKVE